MVAVWPRLRREGLWRVECDAMSGFFLDDGFDVNARRRRVRCPADDSGVGKRYNRAVGSRRSIKDDPQEALRRMLVADYRLQLREFKEIVVWGPSSEPPPQATNGRPRMITFHDDGDGDGDQDADD
jgi:hypothetical protein